MQAIKDLKLYFHHRYLANELKKRKQNRKSIDFAHAKVIGIVYDGSELKQREIVEKFVVNLKKKGKDVKVLAYLNEKERNENHSFKHFSNKEIDWMLRPKGEEIDNFLNQQQDILMVLDTKTSILFEYIATLSKASLRVGPYSEHTYAFDFMVDVPADKDLNYFITQAEFFLNKTTLHGEPAV